MSRAVRRVPLDWQHPMVWRQRWNRAEGRSRMQLVPRGLMESYSGAMEYWESEGNELARREGFDWRFWSEYCLTGFKGQNDSEPTIHPYDTGDELVAVRDADHLHELLTATHLGQRPDPADYMPEFEEGTATGWCMYETTSEGTPISPVFEDPDELARWLADNEASAFGSSTATYDQWLGMIRAGWAPSAAMDSAGLRSGVEAIGEVQS